MRLHGVWLIQKAQIIEPGAFLPKKAIIQANKPILRYNEVYTNDPDHLKR
jgi:hypothetical protein